ncbi:heterokaryon incompatibility protein-domain-containing protein [Pseudoneurospora amorphoporcata]|uniref:Heterokaryon incompatibility protein-domain-containing protein n=1 Tax=Pseudoneurospora amorphoporcata TaxID=241081 RepID=A0AAN6P5B1_9PEZI|nr:heterokaryon incompatibility protein-domain-containing protein [Pseudoneurospora amorphoporcata]
MTWANLAVKNLGGCELKDSETRTNDGTHRAGMTEPNEPGLSSPDPENEHHLHPRPHLCSACSQIDFKALFTSHKRHPEVADNPQCSFCAFYKDCVRQSRDIALRMESCPDDFPTGLLLKGFHSLSWFWMEHEACEAEDHPNRRHWCQHYVQDVFAMQVHNGMGHAILRVVDGHPNSSALTRPREAGGGLLARRILPDQVNYHLIGEWLRLCLLGHVQCHGDGDSDVMTIPGFRVIDCTTRSIVSAVEAFGNHDKLDYVTLSYVWGQAGFSGPVLREDGLSLPDELPLVISDAMEVVKRVGYRYLWVDRYCIPQDDIRTKQIQIKNMDKIYSYSTLTIIAAAGEGPEYGLPGVSSRHRPEQLCVQVADGISLALYESPKVLVTASKWHTRGWTYQEGPCWEHKKGLLSKRRLIFTDLLVYFQCYEMHGTKSYQSQYLTRLAHKMGKVDMKGLTVSNYISFQHKESDFGSVFPHRVTHWSDPGTIWKRISEFARKPLAFESDTLNAIAGIFGKYSSHMKEDEVFFLGEIVYEGKQNLWACSFRQLPPIPLGQHLCRSFTNGSDSAFSDISSNLTYKLVYSLFWIGYWDHVDDEELRPAFIPTDLKQVRRSGFSSWTWAGWKTCIIKHREELMGPNALDIYTEAYVEYEDKGAIVQKLSWKRQNKEILDLVRQGDKIPACLILKAPVFDMRLKLTSKPWKPLGKWTFTWPPFLEGEKIDSLPRVLLEDIEHERGSNSSSTSNKCNEGTNLLGLLLALNGGQSSVHRIWLLILKPVRRALNGRQELMPTPLKELRGLW